MRPCNAPHYKGPGPAICNAYARPPPRHSTLIVPFCHFAGYVCAAGLEARPSSHHRFSPQISSHLEISCVLGIPPRILPPSVALILICLTQFSLRRRLAVYKYRMSHIILPFLVLLFSLIPPPPPSSKNTPSPSCSSFSVSLPNGGL